MTDRKTELKLRVRRPLPGDAEMDALRERNAARLAEAKRSLGNRHILHPDNHDTEWGRKRK